MLFENGLLTCKVKTCFLGQAGVGKSSIIYKLTKNKFSSVSPATVGSSFHIKHIETLKESVKCDVTFELWDTAGQERFTSLAPMYYRGAAICFIVFSIDDADSFGKVEFWCEEVMKTLTANASSEQTTDSPKKPEFMDHRSTKLIIVGNKSDRENERVVNPHNVVPYVEKYNALYFETSAKEGSSVLSMFEAIAGQLTSQYPVLVFSQDGIPPTKPLDLTAKPTNETKQSSYCSC